MLVYILHELWSVVIGSEIESKVEIKNSRHIYTAEYNFVNSRQI